VSHSAVRRGRALDQQDYNLRRGWDNVGLHYQIIGTEHWRQQRDKTLRELLHALTLADRAVLIAEEINPNPKLKQQKATMP
jgi:hypothetical protein